MKALLWIAIAIAVVIVIKELAWIGKSDIALLFIGLGVAVALQGAYLLLRR